MNSASPCIDRIDAAGTIAAAFAYLTANRDELLPRKPLPAPAGTR
jgi:hypothetical protein